MISALAGLRCRAAGLRLARPQVPAALQGRGAAATACAGACVGAAAASAQCAAVPGPTPVETGEVELDQPGYAEAADVGMADGSPTRESEARVIPLVARIGKLFAIKKVALKQAVASNIRYVAYSSDVGESFRPVLPGRAVQATYGLAIGYVCCDVGYHVYQETQLPETAPKSISRCVVHNTVFQLIASLALPAFIIHSGVHQAQRSFKKLGRYTKWGPTVVGLAMIPFLPACVDYPAEVVIDTGFAYTWPHPVRYDEAEESKPRAPLLPRSLCPCRHLILLCPLADLAAVSRFVANAAGWRWLRSEESTGTRSTSRR
jgi:fission process protein 1